MVAFFETDECGAPAAGMHTGLMGCGPSHIAVVFYGLSRFTWTFPCTRRVSGEETPQLLITGWFQRYETLQEIHFGEVQGICSDTVWYKGALHCLKVHVSTGIPYIHSSNFSYEHPNRGFQLVMSTFFEAL